MPFVLLCALCTRQQSLGSSFFISLPSQVDRSRYMQDPSLKTLNNLQQKPLTAEEQQAQRRQPLESKKVIEHYEFGIQNIISRNQNSEVYAGIDRKNHREVAVKAVLLRSLAGEQSKRQLQNQMQYSKTLAAHPNLVRVFDVFQSSNNCYFMMEKGANDLKNALRRKKVFTEQEFRPYFAGIVSAIAELRKSGVIHCDLRLSNVLVTKEGTPKLCDFAKCRLVSREDSDEEEFAPQEWTPYMSPNTLVTKKFSESNEVWSLSVLTYQCLHGYNRFPWKFDSFSDLLQKIYENKIEFSNSLSIQMTEFLKKSLNQKSQMSVQQLLQEPVVQLYYGRCPRNCVSIPNTGETAVLSQQFKKRQERGPDRQFFESNKSPTKGQLRNTDVEIETKKGQGFVPLQNKKRQEQEIRVEELRSPNLKRILTREFDRVEEPGTEECIDSQVCFMRFLSIILKQDELKADERIRDPLYRETRSKRQFDHSLFRLLLIKQIIALRRDLSKMFAHPLQNPLCIPGLQRFIGDGSNSHKCQKIAAKLKEYEEKYRPYEDELMGHVEYLNHYKSRIELNWRSLDLIDTGVERRESHSIFLIKLAIEKCKVVWGEINEALKRHESAAFKEGVMREIESKALRLDFLISFYLISCCLVENFEDPVRFAKNSGLQIILNYKPLKFDKDQVHLLREKMESLDFL